MTIQRLPLHSTHRPLEVILHWQREGFLLLSPPYQRGDVWGPVRQRNLIQSILRGIPIPSIIVNDRMQSREWGGDGSEHIAVIDGKQRLTAILKFLAGDLEIPREWFTEKDIAFTSHGDLDFFDLTVARQRGIRQTPIAFSEGSLRSIEEEREVFELVNYGGVPQGQSDLPES